VGTCRSRAVGTKHGRRKRSDERRAPDATGFALANAYAVSLPELILASGSLEADVLSFPLPTCASSLLATTSERRKSTNGGFALIGSHSAQPLAHTLVVSEMMPEIQGSCSCARETLSPRLYPPALCR
jgi:hypothetical protein